MQPIHTAASSGQPEVMVELIQKFGVDPRETSDVGNQHVKIVKYY